MARLSVGLVGTRVSKIYLTGCGIDNEGASALFALLPDTNITHLWLNRNKIDDDGVANLCDVLPRTKIILMYLSLNDITFRGRELLADVIPRTHIQFISMNCLFVSRSRLRDAVHVNGHNECRRSLTMQELCHMAMEKDEQMNRKRLRDTPTAVLEKYERVRRMRRRLLSWE